VRTDAGTNDSRPVAGVDARYRTISEHLPGLLAVVFDGDLYVELATGAALRDRGPGPDALVGRRLPEVAPTPMAERLQAVLAGERQAFEQPGWWDPERVWAVEVVPLRDPMGAVAGGIAFAADVTERDRVERELRLQRRQLAEAQRVARVGSMELDLRSGQITASEELLRILGLPAGFELTLEAGMDLVHPEDRERVEQAVARTRVDPAPFHIEHRAIRPDGTVLTLVARGEGIRDQAGRVVRVVATDQDVTEAKQAEEERQRLLGRLYEVQEGQHQRLAADLHDSHVQNLAAIGLKLDQIRLRLGPDAPAPVRDRLDELREEVNAEVAALRRTIGALRPLVLDQRGLEAAVRDLAAAVCLRAALVSCEVSYDLGAARLTPVAETALFRVVQQALANVEQHAAARHVQVALYQEGPLAVLRVEDDGCGFDPTEAEALAGCEGFGLTFMRERVQALGGDFLVDAAAGAGTRIRVRVPARPTDEAGP
jgi:PAS domain S-box-containing protein